MALIVKNPRYMVKAQRAKNGQQPLRFLGSLILESLSFLADNLRANTSPPLRDCSTLDRSRNLPMWEHVGDIHQRGRICKPNSTLPQQPRRRPSGAVLQIRVQFGGIECNKPSGLRSEYHTSHSGRKDGVIRGFLSNRISRIFQSVPFSWPKAQSKNRCPKTRGMLFGQRSF